MIKEEAGETVAEQDAVATNKYTQILGLREVHFLSSFALIYVGVEFTVGSACPRCSHSAFLLLTRVWSRLERDVHPGAAERR